MLVGDQIPLLRRVSWQDVAHPIGAGGILAVDVEKDPVLVVRVVDTPKVGLVRAFWHIISLSLIHI